MNKKLGFLLAVPLLLTLGVFLRNINYVTHFAAVPVPSSSVDPWNASSAAQGASLRHLQQTVNGSQTFTSQSSTGHSPDGALGGGMDAGGNASLSESFAESVQRLTDLVQQKLPVPPDLQNLMLQRKSHLAKELDKIQALLDLQKGTQAIADPPQDTEIVLIASARRVAGRGPINVHMEYIDPQLDDTPPMDIQKATVGEFAPNEGQAALSDTREVALPVAAASSLSGGKAVHVLVLSYQRSGSSIVGSLLGKEPSIFYMYEPLDSLYTAMYGTAAGWNVPADITTDYDGSFRTPPEVEQTQGASLLKAIYNCDFSSPPPEFFVSPFWWYFSNWTTAAKPYSKCLRAQGITDRNLGSCQRHLRYVCGQRFGDVRFRMGRCKGLLWPYNEQQSFHDIEKKVAKAGIGKSYQGQSLTRQLALYKGCVDMLAKKAQFCVDHYLRQPCQRADVRAVKTVRATMDLVEPLLRDDPGFKVIHLLRDPRGVVRSRAAASWSQGLYERRDYGRCARVYCQTASHDQSKRVDLETAFPGRTLEVVLEQFLQNPQAGTARIFQDFLGLDLPQTALVALRNSMKPGFADRWKTALSESQVTKINNACQQLYLQVPTFTLNVGSKP